MLTSTSDWTGSKIVASVSLMLFPFVLGVHGHIQEFCLFGVRMTKLLPSCWYFLHCTVQTQPWRRLILQWKIQSLLHYEIIVITVNMYILYEWEKKHSKGYSFFQNCISSNVSSALLTNMCETFKTMCSPVLKEQKIWRSSIC